ncbi:cation:proton antiporter [Actinotalea ferrariae CF5-4]|uniref:Cation:proton antiporter n=1 Tax=Actinotalea ferrariae CF5-4 TaxID=948458 RepID=A0A021VR02_9CELL|nr:hydrogen gas-evolving membrane-bound hydrogenase subunit E [Actinotalea ferrariae]EYR63629.1 cation:proton antiporter [Actinotalea ferrariae CF5-4]
MTLLAALLVMATAAALARPLARRLGRDAGYAMAVAMLGALGLVLTGADEVFAGRPVTAEIPWIPALDVAVRLRLDGLSLLFVVVALGVGALVMAYCARYLSETYDHARLYRLLGLFATAMLGLVLADDTVLLFVFFELTTLCSFLLIGGQGLKEARPATRALVVTGTGGLALLTAVVLMWSVTGTTSVTETLARSGEIAASPLAPWIAVTLMLAGMTKSAQVPFHFWLPDAMVALTPVSAYLHAATLVKAGIYVLMRFSPPFADTTLWTVTLVTAGLVTTVVGAVFALQQHDLKALLAYSTVSQLGWIVVLVGVGTDQALAVAGVHTFAHALFKATLFMLVGIIDREAGSRDIRDLSGLYRVMPVTAGLTAIAAMSMAGLPPLLGFVSKEESYYSFLQAPGGWGPVVGSVAVLSAAFTFAYSARILYGAFAGRTEQPDLYEPRLSFLLPAALPAVTSLGLGLFVTSLNPFFTRAVQDTVLGEAEVDLKLWPGLDSVALWMSVVTIALGVGLFLARGPVDRALQRLDLPFSGVQVYDALYARVLRLGDGIGRPARTGALAPHLAWPLVGVAAVAVVGVVVLRDLPAARATTRPEDWVVVALTAVAALGLARTTSRLGAITMLGIVGFLVGVWFLLAGGVDLALTQLLVEILTVVVAVLVLRRLPHRFEPTPRTRRAVAAGAGLVAGAVAGLGTWALAGRREPSAVSRYLLEEGPEGSGGTNVVNTVLVDFRGLDTFGEITVLAVVGMGLLALLRRDRPAERLPRDDDAPGDRTVLYVTSRVVVPVVVVASVVLLWRGHNEPGGGFIAALMGGLAVALVQLPRGLHGRTPLRAEPLLASGVAVAVGAGLLGMLDGSFLRPIRGAVEVGGFYQSLTTSLIFDVGVYLTVLGLVVAAIDRFSHGRTEVAVDVAVRTAGGAGDGSGDPPDDPALPDDDHRPVTTEEAIR